MYTPSQVYDPSKVIRVNPGTLSGLLLVIGRELGTETHFFQFAALDAERLEKVVETFPTPLRDGGKKMIHESAQRALSKNGHNLFYLVGHANTERVYLNPQITEVDRYPLGTVYDFDIFQWLWVEIAVKYFSEYQQQQKPL